MLSSAWMDTRACVWSPPRGASTRRAPAGAMPSRISVCVCERNQVHSAATSYLKTSTSAVFVPPVAMQRVGEVHAFTHQQCQRFGLLIVVAIW